MQVMTDLFASIFGDSLSPTALLITGGLAATLLLSLTLLAACGGDDDPAAPETPDPAKVLVLQDGGTETRVVEILTAAGIDADLGPLYYEYGANDLDRYDAVVFLNCIDYGESLPDSTQTKYVEWIARGGGIVTMEWFLYYADDNEILTGVLPVVEGDDYAYEPETYTRVLDHPIAEGLPRVQRALAHLPVYMIFDDHDVTDDWNLSREWEEVAYGHPFSKRLIGNALFGYLLNQAWGNDPDAFDDGLLDRVQATLASPGGRLHDELVDRLLRFDHWHYTWPTTPPLVVIDSRTHRWRSESAARKPSGLLDWEALTDLQQTLRGLPAVLLVSPAPIFGVKLIETIQRVFTWFGQPLLVDAENWMAHPGAAQVILNIFRHPRTPDHFVVLSGDVPLLRPATLDRVTAAAGLPYPLPRRALTSTKMTRPSCSAIRSISPARQRKLRSTMSKR